MKKKIPYAITGYRIPKKEQKKELYYYELRTWEDNKGFSIKKSEVIHYEGTLVVAIDILKNQESIEDGYNFLTNDCMEYDKHLL